MNEYQHGGAREGSGRKPVHEGPTKVIRVILYSLKVSFKACWTASMRDLQAL